ncbi:MAG: hypothetical protein ACKOZU_10000 [Planctomycetaceae bacterium]
MATTSRWIEWWLSLSPAAVIGILIGLHVGVAAIVNALIEGRWTGGFVKRHCGATPITVMPMMLMFSLLVGFLGAEIAGRNQRAERCIADEARTLEALHFLTRASRAPMAGVREAARRYAVIAVGEFPGFARHGESADAVEAVHELERAGAEYASSPDSPAVAAGSIMESVLLLKKSRSERALLISEQSEFAWITVLGLSILAIVAIGVGHVANRSERITTWSLFIPAVVIVLGMLALRENPYSPPLSVSAAPLELARLHLSER